MFRVKLGFNRIRVRLGLGLGLEFYYYSYIKKREVKG